MANTLLDRFRKMPKQEHMNSGYLLTLMYLCDLASKDQHIAFPGISTIARDINLSSKQVRRHIRKLENDGLVKIVENRFGGDKGQTCRYKIILPEIMGHPGAVDNLITSPTGGPRSSHLRAITTPISGSQTVVKPYITFKDLTNKLGYGWHKNPDLSYLAGQELGVLPNPGEDNYTFVNRLNAKLTEMARL